MWKTVQKNTQSKLIPFFLDSLNPQQALFCKLLSRSYIAVNIIISSFNNLKSY